MIKSMMLVAMMSVSTTMSANNASKPAVKNDKHMTEVTATGHGHQMVVAPAPAKVVITPAQQTYTCQCKECKKHDKQMKHKKNDKKYDCKCRECKSHKTAQQTRGHR